MLAMILTFVLMLALVRFAYNLLDQQAKIKRATSHLYAALSQQSELIGLARKHVHAAINELER